MRGDPARLRQVVDELPANALTWARPGSTVGVGLRAEEHAVTLTVSDIGNRIPADERDQVFDMFFRNDAARHGGLPGLGLGLTVARTIVGQHGGTIAVSEADEAATTFTVRLPAHQPAPTGGRLVPGRSPASQPEHRRPGSWTRRGSIHDDMRVSLVAAVAVLAIAGAALPLRETAAPPPPVTEKPGELFHRHGPGAPVMVVAHRGYWRGAPENSLDAITQAVAHGAQVVEIDIRRTSDGELVLMHDDTVERTTDGRGRVADLTLAQIKALRLRAALGGKYAPLTTVTVPTLREALQAVRDSGALVNLDRGWPYRDQIYDLLVELGQLSQGIFKSGAPIAEATAFLDRDPAILYNHVVGDANAADIGAFPGRAPQAYELVFDRLTDRQIQPAAIARAQATSRVWVSTMWYGMAAGYTDEASLRDPALGWAPLVDRHGADMIQTDDQDELLGWLRARAYGRPWPHLPRGTVRVQAEDYSPAGQGLGYYDRDDENRGGAARPFEGVDVGDTAGAIVVGWIRRGEWIRYDLTVPRTGNYRITARVASPYRPAGRFTLGFDAATTTPPVEVVTTTSHYAFSSQVVADSWPLTRGAHTVTLRIDATAYQNFNLDYLEFSLLD